LGSVKNERSQLLAERNTWKACCKDLEQQSEESQASVKQLEEELAASCSEHTAALSRIYGLEVYVMSQHEEGFYKALCQTIYLF